MKRLSPLAVIVSLAIVAGAVVAVLWPPPVGGELYRRYEGRSDIKASYFKDYKINDSVTVDVTMLEAKTSAGWDTLNIDFDIKKFPEDFMKQIATGKDLVIIHRFADTKIKKCMFGDSASLDAVAVSYKMHAVSVFHITNESERRAVVYHNLDKNKEQFS